MLKLERVFLTKKIQNLFTADTFQNRLQTKQVGGEGEKLREVWRIFYPFESVLIGYQSLIGRSLLFAFPSGLNCKTFSSPFCASNNRWASCGVICPAA